MYKTHNLVFQVQIMSQMSGDRLHRSRHPPRWLQKGKHTGTSKRSTAGSYVQSFFPQAVTWWLKLNVGQINGFVIHNIQCAKKISGNNNTWKHAYAWKTLVVLVWSCGFEQIGRNHATMSSSKRGFQDCSISIRELEVWNRTSGANSLASFSLNREAWNRIGIGGSFSKARNAFLKARNFVVI